MPLSEHEQRLLDQIERALYAEDPKFASNVRGARMRSLSHRRRIQGIVLFVLGLLLLVAGVVVPFRPVGIPVISVLGFLVMFAGAVVAIFSRRTAGDSRRAGSSDQSAAGQGRSTLAQRMEQRFRRRFEEH
jgi:protein-S-isoprenylcysteine O-methyltransferase Ste14